MNMRAEEKENEEDEEDLPTLINHNPGILSRMALNDNKAGMQGLDKEKINRIIHENSVGSKFYENERKKDAQVDSRIQKLLEQVEKITPDQMDLAMGHANAILKELEWTRDLSRTIVHIDMDAFYASVEERDNPDLKNKPMAVGGMGMLCTSNYIARRYGVRAAMPGFIGKKLCPDLILVPLNFAKYTEVSHQVRKILAEYDPNFMPMGLDEAYFDITSYLEARKFMPEAERTFTRTALTEGDQQEEKLIFGMTAQEVVKEIRFKIEKETRLTASAGIAPNTLLSKVASDMNKPNGQFYLEPTTECVMEFVRKLPIRKVSGIGKVSEKMLNAIGVKNCQDLYDQRAVIYSAFSQTMSSYCLRICIGIGSTTLENDSERKSISNERTFRDISNPQEMYEKCEELCDALEADAKKANVRGLTVTLKIKSASFELHTRSKTLFHPVGCKSEIYPVIADLLKQQLTSKKGQLKLRLIGVGLSKLTNKDANEAQQKSIDYYMQKAVSAKKVTKEAITITSTIANDNGESNISIDSEETALVDETSMPIPELPEILETEECVTTDSKQGNEIIGESNNHDERPNEDVGTSKPSTFEVYHCPICVDGFNDLSTLNKHLDQCAVLQKDVGSFSRDPVPLGLKMPQNNNNVESQAQEITCLTCPICNATFCCQDITLEKFNTHVDSCLNRKTIMELVKSENRLGTGSNNSKRTNKNNQISGPPKKRQKKVTKPSCTLDRFFK